MKAVRNLSSVGCSPTGTVRVGATPVTTDNLNSRACLEPIRQALRSAVGQQANQLTLFQVYKHGAVPMALAECPVIDSKHANRTGLCSGLISNRSHAPDERVRTDRKT